MERKYCVVLGVRFHTYTKRRAVEILLSFLDGSEPHTVFTPNPEIVMEAQKDNELKKVLNRGSLVVPDGIGIVFASRFYGSRIRERVAGYDLVQEVFKRIKDTGKTVYFLGGGEGVAEQAKLNMEKKYEGLQIIGVSDGYFDAEREKIIKEEIRRLRPDLLLVGLGAPKQEKWIAENLEYLNSKVFVGVGGSFDIMSGRAKRAPDIWIKCGLEWFYRLITQPARFGRMTRLPRFVLAVLKDSKSTRPR